MAPDRLAAADREALARAVDLRIADLWAELFDLSPEHLDLDLIGWFLRTAYGQGYRDALRETERGSLCREIELARDEPPLGDGTPAGVG